MSVSSVDRPRVLVVGDVMLDRYVHGVVERVSPEAPVLVLREERAEEALGGAGNVARNIASLGGEAWLVAVVGDDEEGDQIINEWDYEEIAIEKDRHTTVKERYLAQGQQLMRRDRESTHPISAAKLEEICESVERMVSDCSVVVLSDYGKGVLSINHSLQVIKAVRRGNKDAFIIVDPSGAYASHYAGCNLIKPNRRELELLTNSRVDSVEAAFRAALILVSKIGGTKVLATLGADGMLLVDETTAEHFRAVEIDAVDVTGAGDTVAAAVAVEIASGRSINDAVTFAIGAAAVAVSSRGTVAVRRDDILARCVKCP